MTNKTTLSVLLLKTDEGKLGRQISNEEVLNCVHEKRDVWSIIKKKGQDCRTYLETWWPYIADH